jgi:hypothetical protein
VLGVVEPAIAIWAVLHTRCHTPQFTYFVAAIPAWASVVDYCLYELVLGLLAARVVRAPSRSDLRLNC